MNNSQKRAKSIYKSRVFWRANPFHILFPLIVIGLSTLIVIVGFISGLNY